jgi:hypothetical protein
LHCIICLAHSYYSSLALYNIIFTLCLNLPILTTDNIAEILPCNYIAYNNNLEILLLNHKIVHKNCPSYLSDFVEFVSDTSARTTRAHKFRLCSPRVGVDAAENSFVIKCSRLWNNLPEKLCSNTNFDSFKSSLKNIYFEGYKEV